MSVFSQEQNDDRGQPRPDEDDGPWDPYEWYRKRAEREKQKQTVGQAALVQTFNSNDADIESSTLNGMAEREQIKKAAPGRKDETVVEEVPTTNKKGEELKAELDDLLDEIDEVLEENAEEFVRSYVQKGGE